MCQCVLHALLWSHIGILMRLLAAEPRSTTGPLFPSQCPCKTFLLTLYSIVWDWRVSRAGLNAFYCHKLVYPFSSSTILHFSSFCLQVGTVGLGSSIGLIGCISLSPSLALPTSFNNNYNNNRWINNE